MDEFVRLTISGPQWWVDRMDALRLYFQREVAACRLMLPLELTDDATDGALLHVTMNANESFNAQWSGSTETPFPNLPVTIRDAGGEHPLMV